MMRRRPSRLAAALGIAFLVLSGAPAEAGPLDDKRAEAERRRQAADERSAQLKASIEGLSAQLSQAVVELDATRARLEQAQSDLAAAQQTLAAVEREAAILTARLQDTTQQRDDLVESIAAESQTANELRDAVGAMARHAYRGGDGPSSLAVMLEAETAADFVGRSQLIETAARTQARTLEKLRDAEAASRNSAARLDAVRQRVEDLTREAEAKVEAADAARASAQSHQDEVARLMADQTARQQQLEALKAQAEAEQAAIDSQRAQIQQELAAIIAEQRAAEEAARQAAIAAGQKPAPPVPPSGSVSGALFANPTSINPMYVTSEYGMRLHPILNYVRLHAGIDLRTGCNTQLYAPRDATVRWSQWRNGFGNQVMLDYGSIDGNSVMSSSNHLTRSVVQAGQQVTRGQLIGYSGNTGLSGACHLHFEVYVNGATVNPRPLLGR